MPELINRDKLFKMCWFDPRWKELKLRLGDYYLIIIESNIGIDRHRDQIYQDFVFRYDFERIKNVWPNKADELLRRYGTGPIKESFAMGNSDFLAQEYDGLDGKLWGFIYRNISLIIDEYGIKHSFTVVKKR